MICAAVFGATSLLAAASALPRLSFDAQGVYELAFNVVPVEISWFLATWVEILGGLCLAVGLFTRFWAASLAILTVIAIFAVHWPESWSSFGELWQGYAVTDKGFGNYRIPLLFLAMLTPLIFLGAGRLSVDCALARALGRKST